MGATWMEMALSLVVVSAVLVFVGWPLFRRTSGTSPREAPSLEPLERQKMEAYAAIKEAEFDLRMGKLSDADFAELTQHYRRQALEAIEQMAKADRVGKGAGQRVRGGAAGRFAYCPTCGKALPPKANFCGACGRPLREAAA